MVLNISIYYSENLTRSLHTRRGATSTKDMLSSGHALNAGHLLYTLPAGARLMILLRSLCLST